MVTAGELVAVLGGRTLKFVAVARKSDGAWGAAFRDLDTGEAVTLVASGGVLEAQAHRLEELEEAAR